MSTDYALACLTCRRAIHLGQRFAVGWSFGHGSNDAAGHRSAGTWLQQHLEAVHLVVVMADPPEDCAWDEYDGAGGFRPEGQ